MQKLGGKRKMDKKIWHDLIENPKDLPEKSGIYIVFTDSGYRESEFIKIIDGTSYFDCFERVIEWTDYLCKRDKRRK